MEIIEKYYSKKEKQFYIVYKNLEYKEIIGRPECNITTIKKFSDFYEAINGNLENVDLREFDFKHVCLKNYNFDGALLPPEIQKKLGITTPNHSMLISNYNNSNKENKFEVPAVLNYSLEAHPDQYNCYIQHCIDFSYK